MNSNYKSSHITTYLLVSIIANLLYVSLMDEF